MAKVRYIDRTSRHSDTEIDIDILKRRSWPGLVAEVVRFSIPSQFDFRLDRSVPCLTLLNVYRNDGETSLASLPRSNKKDLRNKLTFVPRGAELRGWADIDKPSSSMTVYFDGLTAAQEANLSELPPMLEFEDHMLRSAMMQLQAIMQDPLLDSAGYAETLGVLLGFELSRFKVQSTNVQAPQGGLTTRQVRLVTDYLENRLTDRTTIAELSALVDLSRFHFIRAFKKTVGMPPHRFVVHRRVERACELLQDPQLSVSEIATRTGFNSATHFTKSFRRITGTTPTTYRRDAQ